MDITYLKMRGHNVYLYRAIDENGDLIDVCLSDSRDKNAVIRFLMQCAKTTGIKPAQMTTDKEAGFSDAIYQVFGASVKHRDVKYKNNIIEQNHCGLKSWCKPMKGFKSMWSAMISCHGFEQVRQFFKNKIPLSKHRGIFASKFQEILKMA